ncbi:MAG: hypothetical protein JWP91_1335 [Fibrobacteres bacterium]|nr:hypothetical protein [Fibrobacterota bacterium]
MPISLPIPSLNRLCAPIIAGFMTLALALPLASLGQAVDLRGLVTDKAGKPLAQAIVALRNSRTAAGPVSGSTDDQGRFRLFVPEGQLGIGNPVLSPPRPWDGGKFAFRLSVAGPVRMTLRSPQGRLLATPFSGTLAAGDYRSDLGGVRTVIGNRIAWLILEAQGRTQAFLLPPQGTGDARSPVSALPVPHSDASRSAAGKAAASSASAARQGSVPSDVLTVSLPGYVTATLTLAALVDSLPPIRLAPLAYPSVATPGIEFTPPGRLAGVEGLPGFRNAGMLLGFGMPDASFIKRTVDARAFGVLPDDGKDDSRALQNAIDSATGGAGAFNDLTVLELPSGRIDISRQIWVDKDFLILRGKGSDPADPKSTRIVFRPDAETRYDKPSVDGTLPGLDEMTDAGNTAKWFWPGRGLFRVQTREAHPDYQSQLAAAPFNRKDIYQGSINFHWKSGIRVAQAQPYAALAGERIIRLDANKTDMATLKVGGLLWIGAANSRTMYLEQGVTQTEYWENMHMKARVHYIVAVDAVAKTVTVDAPLEFDIPANNTSDGSPALLGTKYYSRVMPLKAVQGVGFENFHATLELKGLPRLDGKGTYAGDPAEAVFNYGNIAPEYALHGIVFKWAAHCWARGLRLDMMGSHPIVTEVAKNIEIARNRFEGSWNKGKGGNGYLRFSRAWDCLIYGNVSRGLRHLTMQWSSSGNVVIGNDLDSDLNMHGGWEHANLMENNIQNVPYFHRSANCMSNCGGSEEPGGEGGAEPGTWYPIWNGAGHHSGKWSGATGPRNVFFRNVMRKQTTEGGTFQDFLPYSMTATTATGPATVFQFNWDRETAEGSHWQAMTKAGAMIESWTNNEQVPFYEAPNLGVNAGRQYPGPSLFAADAEALKAFKP